MLTFDLALIISFLILQSRYIVCLVKIRLSYSSEPTLQNCQVPHHSYDSHVPGQLPLYLSPAVRITTGRCRSSVVRTRRFTPHSASRSSTSTVPVAAPAVLSN